MYLAVLSNREVHDRISVSDETLANLTESKYKAYQKRVMIIQRLKSENLFLLLVVICKEYSNMILKKITSFLYSNVKDKIIRLF